MAINPVVHHRPDGVSLGIHLRWLGGSIYTIEMHRYSVPVVLLLLSLAASHPAQSQQPRFDILITGGSVLDGTGSPARRADIAIKGDRIAAISATPIPRAQAARVIDATGKTVTPGFIDMHAHLDPLLRLPLAESALRQGVTTSLGGPDGGSPLPL